jgi:uncharacterized membrane protein
MIPPAHIGCTLVIFGFSMIFSSIFILSMSVSEQRTKLDDYCFWYYCAGVWILIIGIAASIICGALGI